MLKNYCLSTFLIFISLAANGALAGTPTDSTSVTTFKEQSVMQCPTVTINGTDLDRNSTLVSSTHSNECTSDIQGAVAIGGGSGGGSMATTCPSDYPYLVETRASWGFASLGLIPAVSFGAGATSFTCCKEPTVTVQHTTDWVAPDPNTGRCPHT